MAGGASGNTEAGVTGGASGNVNPHEPFVDVVIACHDERRLIERAVASVLHDPEARAAVRVTIVAHGVPAEVFEKRLAKIDGHWRVEAFSDGVRSAAGPFNHGLGLATARYVMVMGSDDYLEPGAMAAWLGHVRREGPAAAIVPIRIQGGPVLPNPLVRLGHTRRLDTVKDRLFYRTAPLALVARAEIERLSLRMTEGVRVSEDLDFGIRLWAFGGRIDYLPASPSYVIGTDAVERTTLAPLSVEQSFEAVVRLLDGPLPARLNLPQRRALAIKLTRIGVLGMVRLRPSVDAWGGSAGGGDTGAHDTAEDNTRGGDDEVALLASILRRILALAPGVLTVFNRADRRVLDGLMIEPTVRRVLADSAPTYGTTVGRLRSYLTVNPWLSFGRETTLRRFLLMKLDQGQPPRAISFLGD